MVWHLQLDAACFTLELPKCFFSDGKEAKNATSPSSSSLAKPRGKSSSSITGIAHCWQGVVQWQVRDGSQKCQHQFELIHR